MKIKELESQGQPEAALKVARRGIQGVWERKTGSTKQAEALGLHEVLGQRKGGLNCQSFGRLHPHLPQSLSTEGVVNYWVVSQINNER